MESRAGGVRDARSLFQAGGSGSIPTSALQLWVDFIDAGAAKELVREWHSRLPEITNPVQTFKACFGAEFDGRWFAAAIWSCPVARLLPSDGSWLELRRLAIADDAPKNTASRMLAVMTRLIRKTQPSVVRLVSYQDTEVHTGCIYRAAGWVQSSVKPRSRDWNMPGRSRAETQTNAPKVRWEKITQEGFGHVVHQPQVE